MLNSLTCHISVWAHCAYFCVWPSGYVHSYLSSSALLNFGIKAHNEIYMLAELGLIDPSELVLAKLNHGAA